MTQALAGGGKKYVVHFALGYLVIDKEVGMLAYKCGSLGSARNREAQGIAYPFKVADAYTDKVILFSTVEGNVVTRVRIFKLEWRSLCRNSARIEYDDVVCPNRV